MRRILLDTHALIWALESPELLSLNAAEQIVDPNNQILISQISFFEIVIKQTLGKINLGSGLIGLLNETRKQGFEILPLEDVHLLAYAQIPLFSDHRDPFDRLLIATAYHEKLEIITVDEKFKEYPDWVKIIW